MKRSSWLVISVAILILGAIFCADGGERREAVLKLESFDGGFFSIDKPNGWNVITAGACASFAFLIRDPSEPLRQIFCFGEVGPVYLSVQQKQIDYQYMNMGGYPCTWIEMPVVNPLTPGNFLAQFHRIARTQTAQNFMPQCPRLENLQVISEVSQPSPISGGSTQLVRALFTQGGDLGEGLFLVTVAPVLPFTGGPGGGLGYGFSITGITAPKREFRNIENTLVKSIESLNISQSYVNNCLAQQASTYAGILKAGKTLSETSDIIMQGWENRNKVHDIVAEKTSDAILGKERLYDPNTGEVYEFENGFYDKYQLDQNRYEMNNLQPLPGNNYDLWVKAPLDGYKHLK
ncbi:hypothetical protein AMJ44_11430 [candidate division WOR-1 bacterium DG_54_3]|uniref:Uncharacterized protein n=1 Tax=candidate division WOR-1 bacterium DG_54_3 TaxID=1703775 RepID=A0A0S7XR96_UNCSA|nr:MAG: hypothetical protein AMJ44_11430 [candidate division WOR-1 bacterium DG_54_3]